MKKTTYAPAKINLCLHVIGRRADGYHDLAMLMQQVDLQDRVDLDVSTGSSVTVRCPGLVLGEGEKNISGRAAELFLSHIGETRAVAISIEKRIPVAAGLGGGSSDAAAVLLGLNDLLRAGLTRSELMTLGAQLGADVPFFLFGQTAAWATGTGNRLRSWPGLPQVWLVLVNPGIAVSTAAVFQNLGLTHRRPIARIPRFPKGASELVALLQNDLEVVTCQHYPLITSIKERLLACGALGALMSGSGSTVFGVFDDPAAAEYAAGAIAQPGWRIEVVRPL